MVAFFLKVEQSYDEQVILKAVRRSLKGEAACAVMRLWIRTSLTELPAKFDSICGTVQVKETILAESDRFSQVFSVMPVEVSASQREIQLISLSF